MTIAKKSDLSLALVAAAFFLLFLMKGSLVAPPPYPSPAPAGGFDTERAFARLQKILGDERPHPVDSAANDAVLERLTAEIGAMGYAPEIRDDFSCRASPKWSVLSCARVRNIVFRAGPTGAGATLIAAHYDSVAAGPGASDDGAGLAALLEIAALLKRRAPSRPVIFLITDGEEAGLLGAASFVRRDPLAKDVANVINMEARGVSGPAILFQTSTPNGRDIAAFARYAKSPVGNSLAADIYKMLPNDTDLTEFLKLPADELNFAYSDHLSFYHTPRDNLANLDKKSLNQMGSSALASLDGFLRAEVDARKATEHEFVYADAFGKFVVIMPALLAFILNLAAFVASFVGFAREKGPGALASFLAPPIAIVAAGAFGFAGVALVGNLRPEAVWWGAGPGAARAVIYGAAILGGVIAMAISSKAGQRRLIFSSWLWFSLTGVALFALAPGSGGVTGLASGLFLCAAIASFGAPRLFAPLSLLGVAGALLLWTPALAMAETGLGIGKAGAFAAPAALLFMLAAPVFAARERPGALVLAAPVLAVIAGLALAISGPAYSPDEPRALSVLHIEDAETGAAWWTLGDPREKAPDAMAALAPFAPGKIPSLDENLRLVAPARGLGEQPVGVASDGTQPDGAARNVTIRFSSNGADRVIALVPAEAGLSRITVGEDQFDFDPSRQLTIACTGRACADFELRAALGPALTEWKALGVRYGLDAEGAAIAAARPDWAVPIQDGDRRIIIASPEL